MKPKWDADWELIAIIAFCIFLFVLAMVTATTEMGL